MNSSMILSRVRRVLACLGVVSGRSRAVAFTKRGFVTVVLALTAATVHAQYSGNNQTLTVNGVTSNWSGNYKMDYYGGALVVTNVGKLLVTGSTYAMVGGFGATASNNTVLVTDTGSVWSNNSTLYMAYDGAGNQLTIANGGMVYNGIGYIGFASTSSNNTVLVTGNGSVWTNSAGLYLGRSGGGNRLTITNGGTVYATDGTLSAAASSGNNTALVTGTNSVWRNSGPLSLNYVGNQLTIANSGTVYNTDGNIGAIGGSNTVLVTGGGVWTNSGFLYVGQSGGGNQLTITNGGTVYNKGTFGAIGYGSSSNTVLVTGTGSVWNNKANNFVVGNPGSGNQLAIANGGMVYMTGSIATYIGYNAGDNNNAGLVTGPGSVWSNSVFLCVGRAGWGNQLTIANGGMVYNLAGYIGFTGTAANSNRVFVSGSGSVWRTTGTLTVNNAGTGNGLILSNGGVAAVSGTVSINAGGYVTNYVAGIAGGLDMANTSVGALTLNGKMGIVFAGAPTQLGPYWGLRWAGDHTNALKGYTNSGALTISDGPDLPAFWQNKAAIYYDSTNTYVGFHVSSIPATRAGGTLITIR